MNSIHRLGVTIAGLATLALVAGAFVLQGYMAAQEAVAAPTAETARASATADPTATQSPTLAPRTIYINPVPTPNAIKATPPLARQPARVQPPAVIHVVVPGAGGDDGESGD